VVSIGGDWSKELCGGTHVPSTGHIGRVTLLGESSIGSGVRRVDALVGTGAYSHQAKERALVSQVTSLLGGRPEDLPERVSNLMSRLKAAEKELAALRRRELLAAAGKVADTAQDVDGTLVVAHDAGAVSGGDDLRTLALDVRGRLGEARPAVVAVAGTSNGRPAVVVATNAAARELGLRAGQLARTAAGRLGGGGGGKDDVAQGGGTDAAAVPAALEDLVADVRGVVAR